MWTPASPSRPRKKVAAFKWEGHASLYVCCLSASQSQSVSVADTSGFGPDYREPLNGVYSLLTNGNTINFSKVSKTEWQAFGRSALLTGTQIEHELPMVYRSLRVPQFQCDGANEAAKGGGFGAEGEGSGSAFPAAEKPAASSFLLSSQNSPPRHQRRTANFCQSWLRKRGQEIQQLH
jgi:hypothetical protein